MKKRLSREVTLLDLISQEVDVGQLVSKIAFEEHALIEAALEQSNLHFEAAKLRVQCLHRRSALESQLALETSILSQRYRNMPTPAGKREISGGAVNALVESRPSIIALKKKLNRAISKEELAKQLVDVYRSRKDVIRIIIDSGKISMQARELAFLKNNGKLKSLTQDLKTKHRIKDDI